jgi:hypothetical protein
LPAKSAVFAPNPGGFAVQLRIFAIPDPAVAKSGVGSMAYGDHQLAQDVPEVAHCGPEVNSRRRPEIRKLPNFLSRRMEAGLVRCVWAWLVIVWPALVGIARTLPDGTGPAQAEFAL